jgi:hypothetical protein
VRRTISRSTAITVIAAVATLAIYVFRLNRAAGLMVDDAYYVLMAKVLSEGQGYRLISSATTAMVPLYPPGFPAILSAIFFFRPEFPANVYLLKSVSIAAMIGVGLLTYIYLRRRRVQEELAACAAIAVTLTPAFVFLATSTVMSECVFTLVQLAAVVLSHRSVESEAPGRARLWIVAAALMAAATVLTRSAGLVVVLAIGLWLLKERLWKRAMLFGAVVAISMLPWMVYARAHAPTQEERLLHGGSIVYSYGEQIWMRWAGDPASGTVTLRDFPARVGVNIVDVFARGMGGIFVPELLRGPAESGEEMVALGGAAGLGRGSMGGVTATMAISLTLSAIVLIGFVQTARAGITVAELLVPIAFAMVFLWPFWTFRFIVPLTPFVFFYFIAGMRTLAPTRIARLALLCVLGLHVSDHARYIVEARDSELSKDISWLVQARETDDVLDWIVRHGGKGVIATTNPGLVYLRTGRKTLSFDRPLEDWSAWRARGVRYVVCLVAVELPPTRDHTLLYRSPGGFWIIEL